MEYTLISSDLGERMVPLHRLFWLEKRSQWTQLQKQRFNVLFSLTMTILFIQICYELNYVSSSPLNWIITVVSSFDSDMHKELNNVVSSHNLSTDNA